MRSRLDQIEARLKAFIESSSYILPGPHRKDALAHQLVSAIERAAIQDIDGTYISTDLFTIRLHPESLTSWNSHPGWIESLAFTLNEAAREVGVRFYYPPAIQLLADPYIEVDHFEIETSSRMRKMDETGVYPLQEEKPVVDTRPNQAFLILNGATIPIRLPVVNVGRRQDNQIVIDDPRVSRTHAQLRTARGHYVLLDLNSTGGTFINGVRVTQQVLNPGDVISLAGVPLIYGEDNQAPAPGRGDLHTGRLDSNEPSAHH